MKKLLTFTIMCLVAIAAMAQEKADILVGYDCNVPTRYSKMETTRMSLLANATNAKYFNDISLWVDSLKSTPEGNAKYREIIKKTCMTVEPDGSVSFDLRKGPAKITHTYVFTNLSEGNLTFFDKFGEDTGLYIEPIDEINWTIVEDSTQTVLDYECIMAETDYHGRHWKAWFTPEIPAPFGPWKLRGLPGLVLKADTDGGFSFVATGLEKTDRIITPMYMQENYSKVDRLKALDNAEYFMNHEESILNAQGQNVRVVHLDDDGNETEIPKYDGFKHSLEPDYKMKK